MAVIFDNCYGCIELRKGCLIIGYLKMILTMYVLTQSLGGIVYGDYMIRYHAKPQDLEIMSGLTMIIFFSIILALCLFQLAFTIVLLVGIHRNKLRHVKAYLIFAAAFLVIFTIGSVISILLFFFTFSAFYTTVIVFSITVYNFIIIRSYYIRMGDDLKPDKGQDKGAHPEKIHIEGN